MSMRSLHGPILSVFLLAIIVPSAIRPATSVHAATTLFADGLESGTFSAWTSVKSGADGAAVVQSSVVKSGSYAARFAVTTTAGSFAYARTTLPAAQSDLIASGDFQVTQEGTANNQVPLLRLFTPSGVFLAGLYRQNQDYNQLWVQDGGGHYFNTNATLPLGTWGHLDLHVVVNGTTSTIAVSLNGTQTFSTGAASLGSSGVQIVQIGTESAGQAGIIYADTISVSTASGTPTPTPTPSPTPSPTPGPAPVSLIQNGSFEQGGTGWLTPWTLLTHGTASASIAPDATIRGDGATSAAISVATTGATTDVQLTQSGLTLTGKQQYLISFFTQAASTGTVGVALEAGGNPNSPVWSQSVSVGSAQSTRWMRSLLFAYTPSATQSNLTLAFNVGTLAGKVWFDSVAIATAPAVPVPGSGANEVQNPSFEQTGSSWLSPWYFTVKSGAAATISQDFSTSAAGSASALVTVTQASSSNWQVQLAQSNLPLTAGQRITVSFAAKASAAHTVTVVLQQNVSPYTTYISNQVTLGTSWQTYSFSYSPSTSTAVFLGFNLAAVTGQVWLDAASVQGGGGSALTGKGVAWWDPAEYWGSNHAGIDSDLVDMANAGITWVCLNMYYYPTPNANFDYVVQDAFIRHIHLLVTVWNASPGDDLGTDAQRATYKAWLSAMVARYKYWVTDWQIGNEPNIHYNWNIDATPTSDPVAYAAAVHNFVLHLQDSYTTIKAADPTATVVMGGLCEWTEERYLYQLIAEHAYQYFDVMAAHPYGSDPGTDVGRLQALQVRMAAQPALAAKPLWVTEVGFNTSWTTKTGYVTGEQQQADYLTQVLPALRAAGAALPIFWYTLREDSDVPGYGLEQKDPTSLLTSYFPAYAAYKQLALT